MKSSVGFSMLVVYGIRVAYGLIGFDCATPHTNITTISLKEIGDCNIPDARVDNTTEYIQLLQLTHMGTVHVQVCKVEITRVISWCGHSSHVSIVAGGTAEYVHETSREQCVKMHETGHLFFGQTTIAGIRKNSTSSFPTTLAGKVDRGGNCIGAHYTDPYGNWDYVVVQGMVKVTLMDYKATTQLDNNVVILNSGTRCMLNAGTCIDVLGGYNFWISTPEDNCSFRSYTALYRGIAEKIVDRSHKQPEVVYRLQSDEMTFALTTNGGRTLCGYQLVTTEHPKLFILVGNHKIIFNLARTVEGLDLFTYINSKFVYVERHVRTQMNTLYRDALLHRCKLEQDILRNSQTLALIKPEEFAFNYNRGPGFTAIVTGEVLRLIKCVPVEVKVANLGACYQELPVTRGNESYFLMPRTHILKSKGYEIPCNTALPTMYEIDGAWFKLMPFATDTASPHIMTPRKQLTWTYQSPGNLAESGIYTAQDLERIKDSIMLPFEQPAIVNNIVRIATGATTNAGGLSFGGFLDTETLEKIARSTWSKLWSGFTSFGMFSAGILGIIIVMRGVKFFIDTCIHLFALHAVYGWSYIMIGSVMDSVTNYLLHFKPRTPKTNGSPTGLQDLQESAPPSARVGDTHITIYPAEELAKVSLNESIAKPTTPSAETTLEKKIYGLST